MTNGGYMEHILVSLFLFGRAVVGGGGRGTNSVPELGLSRRRQVRQRSDVDCGRATLPTPHILLLLLLLHRRRHEGGGGGGQNRNLLL